MKWLFLLIGLLFFTEAKANDEVRFALLIGANLGDLGDEPLKYAERDASRMGHILSRFGGVPEENILLLNGRSASRIEGAFHSLSARIQALQSNGKDALLFVYYSGHADASSMHLGRTQLSFSRLTQRLETSGARLKVLVVDACRSGELTRVKGAKPTHPFKIIMPNVLKSEGNAILTSSAAGEDAQESERLGGGVFSHHFMSGLRGAADSSGDKQVSLSEAYQYAYAETLRTTSRARFLQHPTYAFKMKGRQDLIITRLVPDSGLGTLDLLGTGTWLLMSRTHGASGVIELSTKRRTRVIVNPDSYTLRLRTANSVYEGKVEVNAGASTRIGTRQMAMIPYGQTVRKGLRRPRDLVFGLSAEVLAIGPITGGIGPNLGGALGLRLDLAPLTLEVRGRFAIAQSENLDLKINQLLLGADLTVLKLFDPGPVSIGFGLRMGSDWIQQHFHTRGYSPDKATLAARAAPVLRVELPLANRINLIASGFVDGIWVPKNETRTLIAAPGADFGLSLVFP